MAVLKSTSLLDEIVNSIDSKFPANINYVKARMIIEQANLPRSPKRELKMEVISYLNGAIKHPSPTEKARGAANTVVFTDNTHARF